MGYQIYQIGGNRWGGYGVLAICEHPDCNEEIDRGISYACGGEPGSEYGCDRYFCGKHLQYTCVTRSVEGHDCEIDIDQEGDCELKELCERCVNWYEGGDPGKMANFPYKPEHPEWVTHLLGDESWEQWRKENPKQVESLLKTNFHA